MAVTEKDLQAAINKATLEFIEENRDEIIKRAHRILREEALANTPQVELAKKGL